MIGQRHVPSEGADGGAHPDRCNSICAASGSVDASVASLGMTPPPTGCLAWRGGWARQPL